MSNEDEKKEVFINIEALQEHMISEVCLDGTEKYITPITYNEAMVKISNQLSFTGDEDVNEVEEEGSVVATDNGPVWPWEPVASKLRHALTEVSVLHDILLIAKERKYLSMEPSASDPIRPRINFIYHAKKQALSSAADILLLGAKTSSQIVDSQDEDFYTNLLDLRESWKLRRTGSQIYGDLSYRSVGSKFAGNSGIFQVVKQRNTDLKVELPLDLCKKQWLAVRIVYKEPIESHSFRHEYLMDTFQIKGKPSKYMCNESAYISRSIPLSPIPEQLSSKRKYSNIVAAQYTLFCQELFSELCRQVNTFSIGLTPTVNENLITVYLSDNVYLEIELLNLKDFEGNADKKIDPDCSIYSTKAFFEEKLLESSLHHILRKVHFSRNNPGFPHPASAPIGLNKSVRIAGMLPLSSEEIDEPIDSMLTQIVNQARHLVMKRRVTYIVDSMAGKLKTLSLTYHWAAVNGSTVSTMFIMLSVPCYDHLKAVFRTIQVHSNEVIVYSSETNKTYSNLNVFATHLESLIPELYTQLAETLAKSLGWSTIQMQPNLPRKPSENIYYLPTYASCLVENKKLSRIKLNCYSEFDVEITIYFVSKKEFKDNKSQLNDVFASVNEVKRSISFKQIPGKNFAVKILHLLSIVG